MGEHFRPQKAHESDDDYTQRVSHNMLTHYNDPLMAASVILCKQHHEWSPLECAKFVLDYEEWFGQHQDHRDYGIWSYFKRTHADIISKLRFCEDRRSGIITSNVNECMTLDGRHAADVGKFDYDRITRPRTRWRGGILEGAPHGFEESVRKREAIPVDDPEQGHLLIKHIDKDGNSSVRQIVPRREEPLRLPSLFPQLPDAYDDDPRGWEDRPALEQGKSKK